MILGAVIQVTPVTFGLDRRDFFAVEPVDEHRGPFDRHDLLDAALLDELTEGRMTNNAGMEQRRLAGLISRRTQPGSTPGPATTFGVGGAGPVVGESDRRLPNRTSAPSLPDCEDLVVRVTSIDTTSAEP